MKAILYRSGFSKMIEVERFLPILKVPIYSDLSFAEEVSNGMIPLERNKDKGLRIWEFELRSHLESDLAVYKFLKEEQ